MTCHHVCSNPACVLYLAPLAVTHLLGLKMPECMWLLTVCHFPALLLPASTLLELSLRLGPAPVPPPASHFSNEPLQTARRTRTGRTDGRTDAHRERDGQQNRAKERYEFIKILRIMESDNPLPCFAHIRLNNKQGKNWDINSSLSILTF